MSDRIRVLYVDDDARSLEMRASILREEFGFDVTTATDVDTGLSYLADESYDCILSDYKMPDRDGFDFLAAVRERDPTLPFILFTAVESADVANRAFESGATDYVPKSVINISYELLGERIKQAVAQHKFLHRLEADIDAEAVASTSALTDAAIGSIEDELGPEADSSGGAGDELEAAIEASQDNPDDPLALELEGLFTSPETDTADTTDATDTLPVLHPSEESDELIDVLREAFLDDLSSAPATTDASGESIHPYLVDAAKPAVGVPNEEEPADPVNGDPFLELLEAGLAPEPADAQLTATTTQPENTEAVASTIESVLLADLDDGATGQPLDPVIEATDNGSDDADSMGTASPALSEAESSGSEAFVSEVEALLTAADSSPTDASTSSEEEGDGEWEEVFAALSSESSAASAAVDVTTTTEHDSEVESASPEGTEFPTDDVAGTTSSSDLDETDTPRTAVGFEHDQTTAGETDRIESEESDETDQRRIDTEVASEISSVLDERSPLDSETTSSRELQQAEPAAIDGESTTATEAMADETESAASRIDDAPIMDREETDSTSHDDQHGTPGVGGEVDDQPTEQTAVDAGHSDETTSHDVEQEGMAATEGTADSQAEVSISADARASAVEDGTPDPMDESDDSETPADEPEVPAADESESATVATTPGVEEQKRDVTTSDVSDTEDRIAVDETQSGDETAVTAEVDQSESGEASDDSEVQPIDRDDEIENEVDHADNVSVQDPDEPEESEETTETADVTDEEASSFADFSREQLVNLVGRLVSTDDESDGEADSEAEDEAESRDASDEPVAVEDGTATESETAEESIDLDGAIEQSRTATDTEAVRAEWEDADGYDRPDDLELQPGDSLLVQCGSQDDRRHAACRDVRSPATRDHANVLQVRYRELDRAELESIAVDAAETTIIAVGYQQPVPEAWDDEIEVIHINNPNDLTRLGIVITGVLDSWQDEGMPIAVCFDQLEVVLQYKPVQNVFRFLHVLLGKLRSANAVSHFHVDPTAGDPQETNVLKPLYDDVLTIDSLGVSLE